MTDVRSIYLTAADAEGARSLAESLLERHLIACANVFPSMLSLYRWQGETVRDEEVAMIVKTTVDRVSEVLDAVHDLHPYEVPCAVVWPVETGIDAYLEWVRGETRREPDES